MTIENKLVLYWFLLSIPALISVQHVVLNFLYRLFSSLLKLHVNCNIQFDTLWTIWDFPTVLCANWNKYAILPSPPLATYWKYSSLGDFRDLTISFHDMVSFSVRFSPCWQVWLSQTPPWCVQFSQLTLSTIPHTGNKQRLPTCNLHVMPDFTNI